MEIIAFFGLLATLAVVTAIYFSDAQRANAIVAAVRELVKLFRKP